MQQGRTYVSCAGLRVGLKECAGFKAIILSLFGPVRSKIEDEEFHVGVVVSGVTMTLDVKAICPGSMRDIASLNQSVVEWLNMREHLARAISDPRQSTSITSTKAKPPYSPPLPLKSATSLSTTPSVNAQTVLLYGAANAYPAHHMPLYPCS